MKQSVQRIVAVVSMVAMVCAGSLLKVGLAAADTSNWQRSVMIQPTSNSDFASASFQQSVKNAVNDGANYIVLIVPIHQSNVSSTDVQTGGDTPTDQSITSAVSYIHGLGAHAAINIHDDPYDGQWRANINPGDRTSWFANYGSQLKHYASLAKTTGTEEMVLGTELSHMTDPTINSTNTANWVTMIASVRAVYNGKLTYSAQHDGYLSDLQNIGFWDKLDYIGVSAYYGMGNDTSVSAITNQWKTIDQNNLAPLAAKYGKQILFTEIGYASKAGSLSDPGTAYQQSGGYDPTLQANAYSALFSYWGASSHFAGVAWWDWKTNPSAGGSGDTDYTPQNKPAEGIMKQGFAGGGGMGGGTTTTPPTTGGGTTTPPAIPGPVAGTTYPTTASGSSPAIAGSPVTVTANVSASAPTSGVLIDVEVYDASGKQVIQKYYDNQTINSTATPYSFSWTPMAAGDYSVKVGVFNANWQGNLSWNGNAGNITVASTAPTTPPPANGGTTTPPATTPPTTTPPTTGGGTTPPTTTPTTANLSIWWPGATQAVSGVQPFKTVLDGRDLGSYTMYWQVDGGTLNAMGNSTDGSAHKESLVDLSGWNWQPTGKYTINFVAKDSSGNVIAQKPVVITVTH